MGQWLIFIASAAAAGGYYLWQRAKEGRETDTDTSSDVTVGVGTGVTTGAVGQDIAGKEKEFDKSLYGGVAKGFAVGGVIGGIITSIAGLAIDAFRAPPKPPNMSRWGIPFRPEWTIWDDVEKRATFFIPGPGDAGIEPVEITFTFDKLLELFNGVDINTIRESGVVSWRPGDGIDPVNQILYDDNVAGGWLKKWEARHFKTWTDYDIPGGGYGIVPSQIRWVDLYQSDPRKYSSDQDASRAIIQARRLVYFQASNPRFTGELVKFWHYVTFNRGLLTSDGAKLSNDVIPEQQDNNDLSTYGVWFCYALAHGVKVYLQPYQYVDGVENFKTDTLKVDDTDKGKDVSKIPMRVNGDIVRIKSDVVVQNGNDKPTGGAFTATYPGVLPTYNTQKPRRGFPHLWSVDNA